MNKRSRFNCDTVDTCEWWCFILTEFHFISFKIITIFQVLGFSQSAIMNESVLKLESVSLVSYMRWQLSKYKRGITAAASNIQKNYAEISMGNTNKNNNKRIKFR